MSGRNNNDTETVSSIIREVREIARQERRSNLLQLTRQAFRPNNSEGTRGRRRNQKWKKNIFLLRRSNADFYPSPNECVFLKQCGLGKKEAEINRSWSINKLNSYICQIYEGVPLEDTGFRLGKVNREKKITIIPTPSSIRELENITSRSTLVVIPNQDLQVQDFVNDNRQNYQDAHEISDDSDFEYVPRPRTMTQDPIPTVVHNNNTVENRTNNTTNNNPVPTNNDPVPTSFREEREITHNPSSFWDDITSIYDNENNDSSNIEFPVANEDNIVTLTITRDNMLNEILKMYKEDETLPQKSIKVVFAGEIGLDYGGLTKELFSEFWRLVEADFFKGEDCIIPHLSLSNIRKGQDEHFVTIGKILSHTLILTKSVPSKISRCVYLKLGDLERKISKHVLKEDFLNFLAISERNLLRKAECSFNDLTSRENEDLMDFFQTYGLYEIPKESEISEQIITIAENILCVESLNFIKKIKDGIPLFCDSFFVNLNETKINNLLQRQSVTPAKFLQSLMTVPTDLNSIQNRSQHMPDCVTIFFKNTGIPTAHTCSNTLELPTTYGTYQELGRQFDSILSNEYSFQYTFS